MEIVPFRAEHLFNIDVQESQQHLVGYITPELAKALEGSASFSAIADDGSVLACSGVQPMWDNRAIAWAYLRRDLGANFVKIHRAVKRFLDAYPCRRIEATVDEGFAEGVRWMGMLGFKLETPLPMAAYLPNGRGCYQFSRVK